jgi:hypothetical protein
MSVVVIMESEPPLFLMVSTLHASCRFTSRLNCRKKQPNEKPDGRHHYQKFDEGKALFVIY